MSELSPQPLTCFFNVDKLIARKHTIAYHQRIVQLILEMSESSYNISRSFSAVRKRQDKKKETRLPYESEGRVGKSNKNEKHKFRKDCIVKGSDL